MTKAGILAESFYGECAYLNERLLSYLLLSLITGNAFLQEFDNELIINQYHQVEEGSDNYSYDEDNYDETI